jgi:accessory gene regulator protein AgrB
MGNILSQIKGMMSEGDGKLSNKRVITLLSTLMLIVAFVANVFMAKHIDDNILNAIMFVIIGGMGITGMEKFAPKITDQIKK